MKVKLFIITIPLILVNCFCGSRYEYRIDGTPGLRVKAYSSPFDKHSITITIPFKSDITQYEYEYFYIKLKKTTEEGKVNVKIIKIDWYLIFIESKERILEECETDEPYGECIIEIGSLH